MSRPRNAVIGALIFSLLAGYFVSGHYLAKAPIGLNETAFLAGEAIQALALKIAPNLSKTISGTVLLVLSLLAIAAVAFLAVRASVRSKLAEVDPGRRSFLSGAGSGLVVALGSLILAAVAAASRGLLGLGRGGRGWWGVSREIGGPEVPRTHPEWKQEWKGSRVRSYRRFGRTEWQISDIVLGGGRISGEQGEKVARLALERGVNYVDTSPDYSSSGSEQALGRAIQGVRDQIFIATKFCSPRGHLPPGTPVAEYKRAVEASLGRLGTDYVDLCHIHACDEVERLMDPNVHEAFDRLREEGKVRFLGFSTHTPKLVEVARAGIASGRFDVMMLAYHHGLWAPLDEIIEQGRREQDMGVVAMKTLKGAKHHGLEGFREEAGVYSQAALRWALSNPNVSCAVISFFELQHVDEYLHASGRALTGRDLTVLESYDRRIAGTYCAPHCGACLGSCPQQLPIPDILRYRMYLEDYGWRTEGMRLYAKLEKKASACASCGAPCAGACPLGVPVRERARRAHELLTPA